MAAQGPPYEPPQGGPDDREASDRPPESQPPPQGYPPPPQGPPPGYPPQAYPPPQGYPPPQQGYPPPQQGYPPPQQGYPPPQQGYPPQYGGPPPGYPPPQMPPRYNQAPLASVGARIGAAIIDLLILTIFFIGMSAAFGDIDTSNGFEASLSGAPFLLNLLVDVAYFTVLEGTMAASFGKLAVGTRVVKEDFRKVDFGSAFLRNLLRPVDYFFCFINGIVMISATQKRQRLGDMAGSTLVVRQEFMRE